MDVLDQLQKRVLGSIMNLRNEMMAAGNTRRILPADEISVEKTADGVRVVFVTPKSKAAPKSKPDAQSPGWSGTEKQTD